MALGAFFSAAEVIPLTFLTVEAWCVPAARRRAGVARAGRRSRTAGPSCSSSRSGFWNFLGAGIFGFLINLPIVSYYEIGTALTANHGHAAMMGVYGMLALGLALFCLRYLIPADRWPEKWAKVSLLVDQHRARLDVLRDAAAARDPAALRVGQPRLLRGARAEVPHQRHQRADRVAAAARRHRLHRRRRPARALHRLPRASGTRSSGSRSTSPRTSCSPRSTSRRACRRRPTTRPPPRGSREPRGPPRRRLRRLPARCSAIVARVALGAHAPALAALPHRRLHLRRRRTITGNAPRASTCGRTSSTTSGASMRYRAKAHICNGCPRKGACTDSDHGREIVAAARPLAALRGRPLPPRHRRCMLVALVALLVLVVGGDAAPRARRGRAAARAARACAALVGALAAARLPRASRPNFPASDRGAWSAARDNRRRRTPQAEPLGFAESHGRMISAGARRRVARARGARVRAAAASACCANTSARSSSGSAGCCPSGAPASWP